VEVEVAPDPTAGRAFAAIVADMKGALRQAVGASGAEGKLGDRTGTLTTTRVAS
jgi:hypothetical protein